MNYTLHQLKIFIEVVRLKSITRAAEEMYMTQPALSIQLKNFQGHFDMPLTEVIGKQLHVTDFGFSIAEIAENVINEADGIRYMTKEYSGLFSGKLRIATASTGKYVIPYFLSGFMKKHQGIDLRLDVSNKTAVINSLKNSEVEFALVSVLPEKIDVHEEILLDNNLYLIGNTKKVDKEKPLIYREDGSATRLAMDNYFSSSAQRKSLKLTSNEAVKQAVIAGLGYSILPLIGIKNELSNNELHIIKSQGLPIVTKWRLIWLKKNKKLSAIGQAYLSYVRDHKEQIIEKSFGWYRNYMTK